MRRSDVWSNFAAKLNICYRTQWHEANPRSSLRVRRRVFRDSPSWHRRTQRQPLFVARRNSSEEFRRWLRGFVARRRMFSSFSSASFRHRRSITTKQRNELHIQWIATNPASRVTSQLPINFVLLRWICSCCRGKTPLRRWRTKFRRCFAGAGMGQPVQI